MEIDLRLTAHQLGIHTMYQYRDSDKLESFK